MKRNGRKNILGLLTAIILVAFAACTDNYNEYTPPTGNGEEEVMVKFTIRLPGPGTTATRALDETDEYRVETINVMLFNTTSKKYVDMAECTGESNIKPGTGSSTAHRTKTFTVELKEGNYDIVLIANASSIVKGAVEKAIQEGKTTKAEVMALMTTAMPDDDDKWITDTDAAGYRHIPMWGDAGENITVDENTDLTSTPVQLLRMVAKVDVVVSTKPEDLPKLNDFVLTHVYVYNYNKNGKVVPEDYDDTDNFDWDTDDDLKANYPNLPSPPGTVKKPAIAYIYDDAGDTKKGFDDNKCTYQIYLFEADNHTTDAGGDVIVKDLSDRACLVVGGRYGGPDKEITYYRVDFLGTEDDGTKTPIDVLRNHHYTFNIESVAGDGYEEPDIAFENLPVNMVVNVVPWDEGGLGNSAFDGQNILTVSQEAFVFGKGAITGELSNNILYVFTDFETSVTNARSGWYIEKITDAGTGQEVAAADENNYWLKINKMADNGTGTPVGKGGGDDPGKKTKLMLTVGENDGTENRSAIIRFAAGRLYYDVTVTQTTVEALTLTLEPATDVVFIQRLTPYADNKTVQPVMYPFEVKWNAAATVIVGNTPLEGGGIRAIMLPANGALLDQNTTKREETYNLALTAFNASDVEENPFQERVSQLNFTALNGNQISSAGINVRHINYALLVDNMEEEYVLEGETKTITIRTNFAWKIEVSDADDVLQDGQLFVDEELLVDGKVYESNTTDGHEIQFTITNDRTKSGKKATIVFTDDANSTYRIEIKTALYVGRFGGALVETSNGVWEFQYPLYVSQSEQNGLKWAEVNDVTGAASGMDGKQNTLTLNTRSDVNYPAANWCFNKNANPAGITSTSASNYHWYLPAAQTELIAAGVAHLPYYSNMYWSSTEVSETNAWLFFYLGNVNGAAKSNSHYSTRCVRRIE